MLHPSYTDLMQLVNSEVESGEAPVVNSRYSIVLATSKRARQLIDGVPAMSHPSCPKPLSVAIDELNSSKIHILSEEEAAAATARREEKKKAAAEMEDMVFSVDEEDDEEIDETAKDAEITETAETTEATETDEVEETVSEEE